jgi:hypothetical protein
MSESFQLASEALATRINRRRFLRRTADQVFRGVALLASGAAIGTIFEGVASATSGTCSGPGLGCPGALADYPCGSSRCCGYIRPGAPNNCDCGASGTCRANSPSYPNCYGHDYRHYQIDTGGCWTCISNCHSGVRRTTTCCDCKTNASVCNDPDKGSNRGRCIAWSQSQSSC